MLNANHLHLSREWGQCGTMKICLLLLLCALVPACEAPKSPAQQAMQDALLRVGTNVLVATGDAATERLREELKVKEDVSK